ncbi:hypothetical protein [Actinomadura barringtoniae]|uniref:hypothetical protein n=1 Tax=Actinomadura barringtoniae TaxID=1427535 RepID=UPI0027DD9D00|nr:hypothetical protein [Actinomadura barringtoniae]
MISLVARVGLAVGLLVVCGCDGDAKKPAAGSVTPSAPGSVEPTPTKSKAPVKRVVKVPSGVMAGYVVFDREARKVLVQHDVHQTFRSASVVKILLALDYLERRGKPEGSELELMRVMLRSSDDHAATHFWAEGGKGAIIERMARKLGLTETAPPPADKPGFWGYTALSAADVLKTYRYLVERAPGEDREFVVGQLKRATQCGTDHFDQFFGIPRAVPKPWAIKQGWSGFGDVPAEACREGTFRPVSGPFLGLGRPVLHTTGLLGDNKIMVLLTLHPAGSTYAEASKTITKLAGEIYRASS